MCDFGDIRFWLLHFDQYILIRGSDFTDLYGIFQWFQIMRQILLIQKPVWMSLNQFD